LRVGVICEGITDYVVLGEVVKTQRSVDRLTLLQPPRDRLTGPGPGWQGVRQFLKTEGAGLDIGVHDLVVVHVDADIRTDPAISRQLSVDEEDPGSLERLCDHVKSWFVGGVSANAVIVLPREATDAWLLAAHTNIVRPETVEDPSAVLAERGLIGQRDGRPLKSAEDYRQLSQALVRLIRRRRTAKLPELERFLRKLQAFGRRRA
jgi:hypothetical protein